MAIYHFSAKVISRANGSSAVASAAYRSASRLRDERLERCHDFTNKPGVVHSEIMLPDGATDELRDREVLWNTVEAGEKRKDAQLSREVEFAIPREMSQVHGVELAREFVQRTFVGQGMVADLNVHWDVGADGLAKPHAHVMLSMREVGEKGFGAKVRDWNRTEQVERWREGWAAHVNARLAELDIDVRIDHRSLEDQGLDLEPQSKIGPAASRRTDQGLEADRLDEHREIARRNGERIIADPKLALDAITHGQATFTRHDLARFIHRHSDGKDQFDQVMAAVQASPEMVALGQDGRGQDRFTSREMIAVEERLHRAAELMAQRERHAVGQRDRDRALEHAREHGLDLFGEQRAAFEHVTDGRDLGIVVGYAGAGKSAMLGVAREAWEAAGHHVHGLALSGVAAENLESGSGIASRTLASMEHQWAQGRDALTARDVLVIDEAGMIGSRQMERIVSAAQIAGAKVVLVGDPEQLQAIEAGAAFRSLSERHGGVEIREIRRQREDWQRDATRQLATGRTGEALQSYRQHGAVHDGETREQARQALVDGWDRERLANPGEARIILTHTRDEVQALNLAARERLRQAGSLGQDVAVQTERGERQFAPGDRVMFLKNDRDLGVKNGTLGEIERVSPTTLQVRLDAGRSIDFDLKTYAQVDHGYAATIHKAQGVTVDRAHVLATPGLDRHAAYVALSRHRSGVELHYGRDDFRDADELARTLSRERAKDMATDYARAFGERRDLRLSRPITLGPKPEPQRSIFASFRPKAAAAPEPERQAREPTPAVGRTQRAVQGYAKSLAESELMRERGLPVLPHQRQALDRAREALNGLRPHAAADLETALRRQPDLIGEAAGGRTQRAIRAMQLEAEVRTNPQMRADRFVERWQGLNRQREQLERHGDPGSARRIANRMGDLAFGLERDPQLESLLANRRRDLGLHPIVERDLVRDLSRQIGLGRGLGIGL